jgi:hypothetical protein
MRIRDRAQAGQLLDRLVRRTVLAQRDAVMGEHVHDVQSHQRGQADRRAHVVGEDEEGRAVGHDSAVRGQAVDDRAHRMLAHAEMQIAAGMAPAAAVGTLRVLGAGTGGLKSPKPFSAVKVDGSRSAEPPISAGSRGAIAFMTLPDATRVAMPLDRRERPECRVPARQAIRRACCAAVPPRVRERPAHRRPGARSTRPRSRARARARFAEMRASAAPERGRAARPANPDVLLGQPHLFAPSGEPCASKLSCFRRAVADMGAHQNQRRVAAFRAPARPAARASIAARSLPSSTGVCQP